MSFQSACAMWDLVPITEIIFLTLGSWRDGLVINGNSTAMALRLEIRCLSCMGPSCSVLNENFIFMFWLFVVAWLGSYVFCGVRFYCCCFDSGSYSTRPVWPRNHYATQAGLKLKATLVPQPLKCWHKSPYLIFLFCFFVTAAQAMLQLKTFPLHFQNAEITGMFLHDKNSRSFYLPLFGFVFCCILFGGYDLECEWKSANNLRH